MKHAFGERTAVDLNRKARDIKAELAWITAEVKKHFEGRVLLFTSTEGQLHERTVNDARVTEFHSECGITLTVNTPWEGQRYFNAADPLLVWKDI